MNTINTEVIVIGGGVIGSSLSYFLTEKKIDTILIEKSSIGSGASGLSAGTIWCPSNKYSDNKDLTIENIGDDTLCMGTSKICKEIDERIMKLDDIENIDLVENGSLTITNKYLTGVFLFGVFLYHKIKDYDVEFVLNKNLKKMEPNISDKYICGLHYPCSLHVDPKKMTLGFAELAKKNGLKIYEDTNIINIEKKNNKFIVEVKENEKRFISDHIVVANGIWSGEILKYFALDDQIVPVKGQIWVGDRQDGFNLNKIIFSGDSLFYWYLNKTLNYIKKIPNNVTMDYNNNIYTYHYYGKQMRDGNILFGGLRKPTVRDDFKIEKNLLIKNYDFFRDIFPTYKKPCDGYWSGLMPFSISGKWIMKELKDDLWFCNGFGASGIMKGPMASKLLSLKIEDKLKNR